MSETTASRVPVPFPVCAFSFQISPPSVLCWPSGVFGFAIHSTVLYIPVLNTSHSRHRLRLSEWSQSRTTHGYSHFFVRMVISALPRESVNHHRPHAGSPASDHLPRRLALGRRGRVSGDCDTRMCARAAASQCGRAARCVTRQFARSKLIEGTRSIVPVVHTLDETPPRWQGGVHEQTASARHEVR